MNEFYFRAANKEGNPVSGTVMAENIELAKKKLVAKSLAIFSIIPSEKNKSTKSDFAVFEFEGVDLNGKIVKGTIDSTDEGEAYKKLQLDYELDVYYFISKDATRTDKKNVRENGVDEVLSKWFDDNFKKDLETKKAEKLERNSVSKQTLITIDREKKLESIRHKIDETTEKFSKIIDKYEVNMNKEKISLAKKNIDQLLKLKRSNALENLENLLADLIRLMNDENLWNNENIGYIDEIKKQKKELITFSQNYKKEFKMNFPSELNIDLKKINLQGVKKNIFYTMFLICVSTFGILTLFWVFQIVQILVLEDFGNLAKYIYSFSLWFFTFFSFLLSILLFPFMFYLKTFSRKRLYVQISFSVFVIIVFITFFDVIFYEISL